MLVFYKLCSAEHMAPAKARRDRQMDDGQSDPYVAPQKLIGYWKIPCQKLVSQ